jgi:hypothetical protein
MRIRMKYVRSWVDKKTGWPYARLRRPGLPEISLPGLIGSPEFLAGYHAAMRGEMPTLAIAEMTARRLAELGCSVAQIAAITGHLSLREIARYTAAYDRKQAAGQAMAKLVAAGR